MSSLLSILTFLEGRFDGNDHVRDIAKTGQSIGLRATGTLY
jgi:hypothetical protein